jgi:hypothetical protein
MSCGARREISLRPSQQLLLRTIERPRNPALPIRLFASSRPLVPLAPFGDFNADGSMDSIECRKLKFMMINLETTEPRACAYSTSFPSLLFFLSSFFSFLSFPTTPTSPPHTHSFLSYPFAFFSCLSKAD